MRWVTGSVMIAAAALLSGAVCLCGAPAGAGARPGATHDVNAPGLAPAVLAAVAPASTGGPVSADGSVAARSRPRATVSATRTTLSSGRIRVVVRTNARSVLVRYTTTHRHTITRRVTAGRAIATLPTGAHRVRVRSKATTRLATSGWKSAARRPGAPTPSTSPTPTPSPSPSAPATGGMTATELRVLTLVNQARSVARSCGSTAYPATTALAADAALVAAARAHSQDMQAKDYFSHTSLDGRTPWERMTAAGYSYRTAGENIAAGQPTPEAVMAAWLASPGHCANIMNASFRDLGVGVASGSSSTYGIYWTQDFGSR